MSIWLVDGFFINLDPIQAGGRLTVDAMKAARMGRALVCDHCEKPFRPDCIKKPPLARFHTDLAGLTYGRCPACPRGEEGVSQAVAGTVVSRGDPVLPTAYSHYTEFLSVEQAGGVPFEIPADDHLCHHP